MAQVYGAVYSGIPVYEMICRQVSVMRRRSDSYLNATQILKVAGVDKGRRTKILEREVQVGEHEKVQGGYGKYQGTWIPFERGVEIARQYGVEELLRPLLDYQPGPDDDLDTPKRRRVSRPKVTVDPLEMGDSPKQGPPRKKAAVCDDLAGHMSYPYYQTNGAMAISRPPPTNGERYRAILMSVFLNHESHKIPDLLTNPNPPTDLDIDLIIDDQGHSSVHWASALARINILQLLLNLGADPRRVNFNGESAMMRAVMVSNNFDNDTFPDLLQLLHSSFDLVDKKGRTVLHHVVLTAGIKGRIQAARYYLDHVLTAMKRSGMDVLALVDICDKNGDTALNIASRIGNKHLVEHLLRFGADPEVPNRSGLRPLDFGLEDATIAALFQAKRSENSDPNAAGDGSVYDPSSLQAFGNGNARSNRFLSRGHEVVDEFQSVVASLEKEVQAKTEQLQDTLAQLRAVTSDLRLCREACRELAMRMADTKVTLLKANGAITNGGQEDWQRECDALHSHVLALRSLLETHRIQYPAIDLLPSEIMDGSSPAHDLNVATSMAEERAVYDAASHGDVSKILSAVLGISPSAAEVLAQASRDVNSVAPEGGSSVMSE